MKQTKFFLAVACFFATINISYAYNNTTLELDSVRFDDETGTIERYFGHSKRIRVPEYFEIWNPEEDKYDRVAIRIIAERAFANKHIEYVQFSNGLKTIGKRAFADNDITEIENADIRINYIGDSAFADNNFETIELGDSLRYIGAHAFRNSGLSGEFTIPVNIVEIQEYCFADNNIRLIKGGGNVFLIGDYAFANNHITGIVTHELWEVKEIRRRAFAQNEISTLDFYGHKNLRTIYAHAFEDNKISELILPNSLITIGAYAFLSNELTVVELPRSLRFIALGAFSQNAGLESITLPYLPGCYYEGWEDSDGNLYTNSYTTLHGLSLGSSVISDFNYSYKAKKRTFSILDIRPYYLCERNFVVIGGLVFSQNEKSSTKSTKVKGKISTIPDILKVKVTEKSKVYAMELYTQENKLLYKTKKLEPEFSINLSSYPKGDLVLKTYDAKGNVTENILKRSL